MDQHQISADKRSGNRSIPNRDDDPESIVRLAGQVVRLSMEGGYELRIERTHPGASAVSSFNS